MGKKLRAVDISNAILPDLKEAERHARNAAIAAHRLLVEGEVFKNVRSEWGEEVADKLIDSIIETLTRIKDNAENNDITNARGKYKKTYTYMVRKILGYSYP